jgi:dihydrodipicolinate synthase/N-acetylneuraminate lyase
MKKPPSIVVPIITPFKENGSIYEKGIENIILYLDRIGIKGLWLLGSYGSFPLLSAKEREQFVETAIPIAKSKGMTVYVNVASCFTSQAVTLAKHAEKTGADGVASVVPFYYSSTHYKNSNFIEYFRCIVETVSIPVLYYNNPDTTGFKPSYDLLEELFKIGVSGLKSKGDYSEITSQIELLRKKHPDGLYLSGNTAVHLTGHFLGSSGVTSGTALAVPSLVKNLQESLNAYDIDRACYFQNLVLKVRNIMSKYVGRAVSCYDILAHKGIDVGTCRAPWLRMTPEQAKEIIQDITQIEKNI